MSCDGLQPAWVDYTRRNDPAHPEGVSILEENLEKRGRPKVLCFWTKAPHKLCRLYSRHIRELQERGTLVLAQVTLNHYREMEPGISEEDRTLTELAALLGPSSMRLRFDPIIVGYTTPDHFNRTVRSARAIGITRITTNFLVPRYKGVGALLKRRGFRIDQPTDERKAEILSKMLKMLDREVELAVCAETAHLVERVQGLKEASCADPTWAADVMPSLSGSFKAHPSRKRCGCFYSEDWGVYRNMGGYACPHKCLYCYAK